MTEHARDINSSRPFHNAWEEYVDKGWVPIPLKPKLKKPNDTGTTGRKNPLPKGTKELNAWIKEWADEAPAKANIGLRMDETVIGIDIDHYGEKNGYDQFLKMVEKFGELPPTVISTARPGGKSGIRFYRVPSKHIGKLSWSGKASKHIDIIQYVHRFAAVYPSYHPETEGQYAWYDAEWNRIEIPNVADLPELPESWVKFLTRGFMAKQAKPMDMDSSLTKVQEWYKDHTAQDGMCKTMRKYLNTAIDGLDDAAAHDPLVKGHFSILMAAVDDQAHRGSLEAAEEFEQAWLERVKNEDGKRSGLREAKSEIYRSRAGALRLAKGRITGDSRDEDDDLLESIDWTASGCRCVELSESEGTEDSPVGSYIGLAPTGTLSDPDSYGSTDTGNAEHLWDLSSKGNLIWVTTHDRFILWNGNRWYMDNTEHKLTVNCYRQMNDRQEAWYQAMLQVARNQTDEAEAKKMYAQANKWKQFVNSSADLPRLERCLKRYRNINLESSIKAELLDGNNYLLGMANGVIDFTTNPPTFRQARKGDYVMLNTNINYWPDGLDSIKAHIAEDQDLFLGWKYWNNYLDTFLPEPELRHFTQKILGTVLTGVNEERIMIFLKGKTGSGKSTMLSAIMDAMGDYAGVISYDAFNKKDDANPSMVDALTKRLLTFSEMGDSVKIDAEVLKRIAGGADPIKVRKLYSSAMIEKVFGGTVVVGTNSSPEIKNYDKALDARLCVIPFDHQIMKNGDRTKMNTAMPELLKKYAREVIFHWLYEGYLMYRREGISRNEWPELVELATADFSDDVSDFGLFVKECLVTVEYDGTDFESRDRSAIAADSAYKRYRTWVQKHNPDGNEEFALGPRQFNKKMDSNGFQKKRIRMKPESDSKAAPYAFLGCQFSEEAKTVKFKSGG
ncbi:DNA primase/polymerase [Gordonia phage Xenia2]